MKPRFSSDTLHSIVTSLYRRPNVVLGLYALLQILVPAGALADTVNPVTNMAAAESAQTVSTTTPNAVPAADPQTQLDSDFKRIEKLVKKFYPKANVTISSSNMHFDEKCKNEMGYYSGRLVLAPQSGGILCDITLKPGEYHGDDKNRLPSEVPDGFHTNLTMAPYSKLQNKHLLVRMSFPPDIDVEFKKHFKTLINNFNSGEIAAEAAEEKVAAEEATKKTAADVAAAKAAAEQASKDAAANNQSTFGAANMSDHRFREGRFKVLCPDDIQISHSIQMGLAKVDYSSAGAHGNFNVSYLVMPQAVDTSSAAMGSTQAQRVVQNLPLGLRRLAVGVTGPDATILAHMEEEAKAVQVGDQSNPVVLRNLSAEVGHLTSPFLQHQAAAFIRDVDTSVVRGNRAEETLTGADSLFDKLAGSLIQEINGTGAQQAFVSLKSCPGREIIVSAIKGKPDFGALMRIYICDNYVYELSAVGEKSWLASPAVNKFMSSFEFFGGWDQWQDAQGCQHWQDAQGWEHWRDVDNREHWWDAEHHEHCP
jgi:hypothetical protein